MEAPAEVPCVAVGVPLPQAAGGGPMNGFRLGSVLGFEIRLDYSWFVIFFLILWSLSAGLFPASLPGLSPVAYVVMGTVATILFFASLVAHELSHSVVARSKGIPVEGITLFIFGGMARTSVEAEQPGDELLIAGVGPLMSLALAALFYGIAVLATRMGWGAPTRAIAGYLSFINLLLAAFNLLPGFPLDGGRLFRALAWKYTGDLTKATRWASTGGRWLGYALIAFGFVEAFTGRVLGGLWLVFIGWFLRGAAEMTFRQHLLTRVLAGVTAREVMTPDPETVPRDLTVQQLVDEHFLQRRFQAFPVMEDGRVSGLVTLDQVKRLPRDRWAGMRVWQIMAPEEARIVVGPDEPMTAVVEKMRDSGTGRVLVVRGGRLLGIISGSDVTEWARRTHELGGIGR
jgi:Zn-dependent protease/CBS domain-containing protein